jgi:hypothetical protein
VKAFIFPSALCNVIWRSPLRRLNLFQPTAKHLYDRCQLLSDLAPGRPAAAAPHSFVAAARTAAPAHRRAVSLGSPECADVAVVIDFSLVGQLEAKMEKTFRVATSSGKHWGIQPLALLSIIAVAGTRNHVDPYHYFSTYFARESLSSNI